MSTTPTTPELSPRAPATPPVPLTLAQMPPLPLDGIDRDETAAALAVTAVPPQPSSTLSSSSASSPPSSSSMMKDEHLHSHHRSPSPHTPPLSKAPPFKPINTDKSSPQNPQQFCLRWNNYQSNLTNVFDQLLQNESFVDVTLACDNNSIKCHKMVLSACSPYFQSLFFDNPCQHPIVIMRDVQWSELTAVVEFMYKGEINVRQEQIAPLLRVAEMLKIRGLADVKSDLDLNSESEKMTASSSGLNDLADVTATTSAGKSSTSNHGKRTCHIYSVSFHFV